MLKSVRTVLGQCVKYNLQRTTLQNFYPATSYCLPDYRSVSVRFKYNAYNRGKREAKTPPKKYKFDDDEIDEDNEEDINELLLESEYSHLIKEAIGVQSEITSEENVLVIQPYVKFGPHKSHVPPEVRLAEANDLIRSLDTWSIIESITVPLKAKGKKMVFGEGKVDELRALVKKYNGDPKRKISCVFVSISQLTQVQRINLQTVFGVTVMDRFSVVTQILKAHAKSREARLQIALAELPYIWYYMGTDDAAIYRSQLTDSQKLILRNREKKIKNEIEAIRLRRGKARKRRVDKGIPIVSIVGYTNCGKTTLIKALTGQEKIQPQNKLFATLEVTAHAGNLPCNLKVFYMDTVGFMSDIPTGLMECFIATLEDAMMADLIIHVQDLAHVNVLDQREHVEKTLKNLMFESEVTKDKLLDNILNVGNKCDLVEDLNEAVELFDESINNNKTAEPMHFISCTKGDGLDQLKYAIERNILKVTERKKLIFRIPVTGKQYSWLINNTTVTHVEEEDANSDYMKVHVILTDLALLEFKNTFLKKSK